MIAGGGGYGGDKGLTLPLGQLLRAAWADPDIRQRIKFVLMVFAVFILGVHIPVPVPGVSAAEISAKLQDNAIMDLVNTLGGGALKRISIFSLGMNPYITASIILQVLTQANPAWKKELQEGGEYARRAQNKRTRFLSILLCIVQGSGFIQILSRAAPTMTQPQNVAIVLTFWTAGAMFILWLGEQISEKGIGNGVSLMIFAGIIVSLPQQTSRISEGLSNGTVHPWQVLILVAIFLSATWFVVFFSVAQRRIPIQHARRNVGTKFVGGQSSYLPISLNLVGVIPIIFAISLMYLPAQGAAFIKFEPWHTYLENIAIWLNPLGMFPRWVVGCAVYTLLIFGFSYFYASVQYNPDDISDNLKRSGSYLPGVRPGKQTSDYLDGVISRITFIGAVFLAIVALTQYLAPALSGIQRMSIIGGTTLLIVVSVALDTMRQIESNLLMKRYES